MCVCVWLSLGEKYAVRDILGVCIHTIAILGCVCVFMCMCVCVCVFVCVYFLFGCLWFCVYNAMWILNIIIALQ